VEVERLREEYDVDVRFAPFYLHPETPPEGMPARRIVAPDDPPTRTELRARNLGIQFTRGRTWASNSYLSLQAAEFATEHGDMWRFHRRMFKAYFEDLEDIGDLDTVVRIGVDAGLDADELRAALEDGRYRQTVDEGLAWSRGVGVTAVPTFILDQKYGIVGAQELSTFRQAMQQIGHLPKR
jgi:predicted DsbA family dithiol-disulfide isomerase